MYFAKQKPTMLDKLVANGKSREKDDRRNVNLLY